MLVLGQAVWDAAAPVTVDGSGGVLATALSALGVWVLKLFLEFLSKQKAERREIFESAITLAYHATSDVARKTKTTADDKVAYALGKLKEEMGRKGKEPTLEEIAAARLRFDAMHGQEKALAGLPKTAPAVP